jgi:uncharacterized protein (TIGR02271 family)
MDRDLSQFIPQNGMDVIGADGEKVGEIDGVERDYFIVRKGFFFPQDHYIPMTAISSYEENQVFLNVTKDEALEQEWTNAPGGMETTTSGDQSTLSSTGNVNYNDDDLLTDRDGMVLEDTGYVGQTAEPGVADYNRGEDTLAGIGTDVNNDVSARLDRAANVDRTGETIDVHEEELTASTRPVERGEVRINKEVIEEQQTLEVPVTEEEVEVTRRRVDRDVTVDDHAFEEGTIEVPLRGEEVDVEKRARVVEEIDVDKTARTHNERVTDTVRREEVNIEGDNVDLEDTTDSDRLRRRTDDDLL